MKLCPNRPDGFGPRSPFAPHNLTTCFLDTVLVPLPTWLYLLSLAILFGLSLRSRTNIPASEASLDPKSEAAATPSAKRPRKWTLLILEILYFFLIIASIALSALQIARLEVGNLGIGLLPFTFVTLVIAPLVHYLASSPSSSSPSFVGRLRATARKAIYLNAAVFLLLVIVIAAKIGEEEKGKAVWDMKKGAPGEAGKNGPDGRGQSGKEYKVVDEVTDTGTMVGVYLVLCGLELGLGYMKKGR